MLSPQRSFEPGPPPSLVCSKARQTGFVTGIGRSSTATNGLRCAEEAGIPKGACGGGFDAGAGRREELSNSDFAFDEAFWLLVRVISKS